MTRPIFPLGIGLGVGLGLPKSLGNACALLAPTRIAHAKTKITNALGKKFIAPNLSRCPLVFYFETRSLPSFSRSALMTNRQCGSDLGLGALNAIFRERL